MIRPGHAESSNGSATHTWRFHQAVKLDVAIFIESIIKIDTGEGILAGEQKAYAGITSGWFAPLVENGLPGIRICAARACTAQVIRNFCALAMTGFIAPQHPLVALSEVVRNVETRSLRCDALPVHCSKTTHRPAPGVGNLSVLLNAVPVQAHGLTRLLLSRLAPWLQNGVVQSFSPF